MNRCSRILFPGAPPEPKKWFVDHNLYFVTRLSCATPELQAEWQIHGPVSIAMRDPLDEHSPGRRKFVQLHAHLAKVPAVHFTQRAMDHDSGNGRFGR